ncbi:MAG: glycosyltransferase family 4 protein [Planctomycetaceae bacterium]
MRIAINGLACTPTMTGIGRMTVHSTRAMARLAPQDEFLLYLPRNAPEGLAGGLENLVEVRTSATLAAPLRSVLFEEFELPRRVRGMRVDLYYAPSYLLPAFPGARAEVICVHDLAWRLFPSSKSALFRGYMNARLPAALRRAARIVAVSKATADDLTLFFPEVDRARVRVVHNGVDLAVFHPPARPRPAPRPELDAEPYIAVVGNYDPRKNIETLLGAFPIFRARLRPHRLVLVGPGRPPADRPRAVEVVGYLGERDLAELYRRADIVVQPSLYEGFGLPILEAMACGTPVACADIRVFREVAGDCAEYFDARNALAIADALEALAGDDAARGDLASRGLARAREFTWEASAQRMLAAFREAAG